MRTRSLDLALIVTAVAAAMLLAPSATAAPPPNLVINGDFETGDFTGWTRVPIEPLDPASANWYAYSGTFSPVSILPIPAPPQGAFAAVTDQLGTAAEIMYQDVTLAAGSAHTLTFTLFYDNRAVLFFTPATLSPSTLPNQQFRVDVVTTTAPLDSVAAGDVLANVFQTSVGDARSLAPTPIAFDLTPFAGQTVRLRFAVTHTEWFFNGGIDDVQILGGIDIEKSTNGFDADAPPGPEIEVGDPIAWTYEVRSIGLPLSDVIVWDDHLGVIPGPASGDDGDGVLEPGEVWIYTATGVAEPGKRSNLGLAAATAPDGADVRDFDRSHYFGRFSDVGIDLEKSTNGVDADHAPGPTIAVGEPVEWTYEVTNTGSHPLSLVRVWDNRLGNIPGPESGDDNDDGRLDPGEVWLYKATGIAEPGSYANKGAAGGSGPDGKRVRDEDRSHYFGLLPPVAVDIEKLTNGQDADDPPGPALLVGDVVEWTYVVTNPGAVPLAGVTVWDDRLGNIAGPDSGDDNHDGLLDPGEEWIYSTTGIVRYGRYANVGVAYGTGPFGTRVDDRDHSHYEGRLPVAAIHVEKDINGEDADEAPGPLVQVGDAVRWEFRVTNPGDLPLRNVTVRDGRARIAGPDSGDDNDDGLLDPGETWTYTRSAAARIGPHRDQAVAQGYAGYRRVRATDPGHYAGIVPVFDLAIVKTGPDRVAVGAPITYDYEVTNAGPGVVIPRVRDDRCAPVRYVTGDGNDDGRIDDTETWTYTCTFTPPLTARIINRGLVDAVGVDGIPIPGDVNRSNNVSSWTVYPQ